jgi:peptidoglycan hydrolase-like protein with peptidoglycan-binding domain
MVGTGAVAMSVLLMPAAAAAQPGEAPPQRVATADASVQATCNYSTVNRRGFAGHYSGVTQEPSTTQVTSAGLEAQCLLVRYGDYDPGPIDGVFGPRSQAATRAFQAEMNAAFAAGLSVDGMVGPQTWPWLRWYMA